MSDEEDYEDSDSWSREDPDAAYDRWRDDAPDILSSKLNTFIKSVEEDKTIWYRGRREQIIKDAMSMLAHELDKMRVPPHYCWTEPNNLCADCSKKRWDRLTRTEVKQ